MSRPACDCCYFVVLFVASVSWAPLASPVLSLGRKYEWVIKIFKLQIKDSSEFPEEDRGVCLRVCVFVCVDDES